MTITHTYDPAQYVLVPRDLSPGMFRRMLGRELLNMDRPAFASLKQTYSEFIAAAPPPPAPPTDDARMREFGKALDRYAAGYCDKFVTQRECIEARATVLALYAAALQSQSNEGRICPHGVAHGKPCNDCVICPGCAHQFPAIPVNRQADATDAARYRWLRDSGNHYADVIAPVILVKDVVTGDDMLAEEKLDEAIDAARGAK